MMAVVVVVMTVIVVFVMLRFRFRRAGGTDDKRGDHCAVDEQFGVHLVGWDADPT
jgi:heme/copper-type cytochrome/quinol oxidase subunit 2